MRYPSIPKPELKLRRSVEESTELFLKSRKAVDVANVLEVHPGHLKHWLYEWPGHRKYTRFAIPKKSGGNRNIAIPPKAIAILQGKFKMILDHVYKPKNCVFGFVSGRSVVDGAFCHKKRSRWILNVDLKDFFGSVNFGRVSGLFCALGVGPKAAAVWAHLITLDRALPQGACTSPVVSNMVARQLDHRLLRVARRYHLKYSRYADDITFSTTKKEFPKEIAVLSGPGLDTSDVDLQPTLLNVIANSGFVVNENKTRLCSKDVRQEVTGLTVNEFVNVRRSYIRQLRAMLHAAEKFGFEKAGVEYILKYAPSHRITPDVLDSKDFDVSAYYRSVLYGKLAFMRMVRGKSDSCYVNLCIKAGGIDAEPPRQIREILKMHEEFQVFICHASEDKASVAMPLHEALTKEDIYSFIDTNYIDWGDSFVQKINHALSRAKIVVVILSRNSVGKAWPRKEVNAALAREVEGRIKVLPLMVGDKDEVSRIVSKLPLIEDKLYEHWKGKPSAVAKKIKKILDK